MRNITKDNNNTKHKNNKQQGKYSGISFQSSKKQRVFLLQIQNVISTRKIVGNENLG
jgi:hypothetical protein